MLLLYAARPPNKLGVQACSVVSPCIYIYGAATLIHAKCELGRVFGSHQENPAPQRLKISCLLSQSTSFLPVKRGRGGKTDR